MYMPTQYLPFIRSNFIILMESDWFFPKALWNFLLCCGSVVVSELFLFNIIVTKIQFNKLPLEAYVQSSTSEQRIHYFKQDILTPAFSCPHFLFPFPSTTCFSQTISSQSTKVVCQCLELTSFWSVKAAEMSCVREKY